MKRIFALALAILLCLAFTACKKESESNGNDNDNNKNPFDSIESVTDTSLPDLNGGASINIDDTVGKLQNVTIDETVIYDAKDIKITVTGINVYAAIGPELLFKIENNSDTDIVVQAEYVSVNGFMTGNIFSPTAKAGETVEGDMSIFDNVIVDTGMTLISNIEFELRVMKAETYSKIENVPVSLTTKGNSGTTHSFDPNGVTVYEDENVRIEAVKVANAESFWSNDLYFYIENNSEYDLSADVYSFTIGGTEVDHSFFEPLAKGKKVFAPVDFWESDFSEKGITDITEFEAAFTFAISGKLQNLVKTDVLTVNLK